MVPCYFPQVKKPTAEKDEFYKLLDQIMSTKKVLIGGDFNGHVGSDCGGFGEVHGGYRFGQLNDGGVKLMDWLGSSNIQVRLCRNC